MARSRNLIVFKSQGDVSNKNAKEGSAAGNADRGKRKRPPLRRSRRLSRECLEDNKLAEDERDARPNRVLAKETGSQKKKKVPPKTSRVASKQGGTRRTSGRLPNHRQASTSNANGNQVDRKPAPKKAKGTKRTRTEFEENDGDESLGYSDIRRASKKRRGKSHGGAVEQPAAAVAGPPRRRINRGSRRSSAGSIQDVIMEDAFLGEDLSSSECHSASLVMTTKNPCPDLLVKSEHDHGLKRNIPGPFDASKFTTGYSNFDRYTRDDVDQVSAYATDIFQRLYQAELRHRPLAGYLEQGLQHEINSSMRAMLVDWIVEVHMKFRLLPETLYLCVNILDRYLCVGRRVRRNKLQLVGVTTLLIACKYEEIHPPEVKDCVYITDQAYTRQDILGMEAEILNAVGFRISSGTAYPFLQRFLHITQATRTVENLASYYLERMLQEHCMLQYRGSAVAATAVCLAWNNPGVVEQEGVALGVVRNARGKTSLLCNPTVFTYLSPHLHTSLHASFLVSASDAPRVHRVHLGTDPPCRRRHV